PGQRDQPLKADALLDLGTLGRGALVVPEDRRPQDAVVLVEADEAVHLSGEADGRGPVPDPGKRRLRRAPPVLRVLLGPARPRRRERVLLLGARAHVAGRRDRERLDAGRADVEPDEDRLPSHAGRPDRARSLALDGPAPRL